ncbi:MAG: PAS domain S-box protein [Ferruginibacter sp.]
MLIKKPIDITSIKIKDIKLKILHLEDVQSDAILISKAIKKGNINFEILVVDTKNKFIKALNEATPDIILADHSLPSFNSIEALAILQKTGFQIPFILITATVSEEFAVDILKKGADDYILKDRLHRLPTAILNALEKHRLQNEKEIIVEELIKSESRLKQTQAIAHLGSWELDYSTGIAIWSDEQLKIYGLPPEDSKQSFATWTSYIHPEDLDYVLQKTNQTKTTLDNTDFFHRIIRRDGTVRHLYAQTRVKFNNEGISIGLHGVTQDVTERTEAGESLKRSEANLKAIFENTSEGFILVDANGIVKTFNTKTAQTIFLNTEQEIKVGSNIYDFIHPSRKESYQGVLSKVLAGETIQYDYSFERKNGDTKWFSFTINPAYTKASEIEGVCITSADITQRKEAEEQQSLLASIINSTDDAIITKNLEGIITSWNNSAEKTFGYSTKEMIGKHISILFPSNLLYEEKEILEKIKKGTPIEHYETERLRKDGKIITVSLTISPIKDSFGNIVGASKISRDITGRKIAEENIFKSELRLKEAQSIAKVGSWEKDLKTMESTWSDETYRIFETDPLHFTGDHNKFLQFIHPEDREAINTIFLNLVHNNTPHGFDYRIITPKGNVKFISENWEMHLDDQGEPIRAVGSCQDITERKKAEEKLIQSEKYSRNLFEQAVTGLALSRMDGTLEDVNEAYAKIIGRTIEETLKLTYWEVTPEKYHDQENKVLEELKGTGKFINYEKEYIHKNGNLVPVRLSGNIFEKDGEKFIWSNVEDITELKKADEQNRAQANLLNMIGQAAIATDLDGVVNYWNKAAEDIYGWTSEETIGKNIIHLTPSQATREQALEIMEDLKNGRTWSGEFKVQRKDGTDFPALITDSPIYDQHNKLSGIIGISSDITENKKAEERLIQSEAKLKKAQSIAHVGSWEVNLVDHTHSWSDEFCNIFGIECDEVIPSAEAFLSFVHPQDAALAISSMENAFATFTNSSFSFQFIKKNGKLGQATSEWKFEFDQDDNPIRLDGILRDITEQTKLENETLKAYEEKNSILESIGDAFFAVDKAWTVTYWNKEAEKMLLTPREKIIGNNLWKVFSDSIDSESYKKYHEAKATNQVIDFEDYYAALNKWFAISAYPSDTGLSVFFKDVTERKNSEVEFIRLNALLEVHSKELATSNQELEQFAYVASHDLQEPLRMVTSFLSQIEKKYGNIIDEKGRQYIHFAVDGANRMRHIILDLLEFSRVGQAEDKQEGVDLNELMGEILSLLRKKIEEKKAVIKTGRLPLLKTFRSPLRQVFQNLVNNSLTYHKKDGLPEISIDAKDMESYWEFAVTDNGIGIDPDYFDKIFTIFQRLHNKDEYSGTGIGLAITKKIIESMGGKIWLESEEGKGSTFFFTLPKNT